MNGTNHLHDAWVQQDQDYPKSEGFGPRRINTKVKIIHSTDKANLLESAKGRFWLPKSVSKPNSYNEVWFRENFTIQYLDE
jgi:hypothetical protein